MTPTAQKIDDLLDQPHKINAIVETLAAEGISAVQALDGTGLTPAQLANGDTRVSQNQLLIVCRNAMHLSPDPGLAIAAGRRMSVVHFGMYGYALLSCATAREAIAFALKYRPVALPVIGLDHAVRNGMPGWVFSDPLGLGSDSPLFRFVMDFQIGTLMSLHEDILGGPLDVREICFRGPQPAVSADYARLLGCAARYNQPESALRFDPGAEDRVIAYANPHGVEAAALVCERLMSEVQAVSGGTADLVLQVRRMLLREPGRFPGLETVAAQLHMTSRTLRRKLLAQGTSFQTLQGDIRRQLAMDYLLQTTMTAEDIAIAVGFNDAAALRRAFRRWSGTSPGAWRQKMLSAN